MSTTPYLVHHKAGRVYACPECFAAAPYLRRYREGGVRTTNDDCLRCGACGHEFGLADAVDRLTEPNRLRVTGGGGS